MSTVLYFSGTGNCYHVAKRIAEHQGAKLISMAEYDEPSLNDDKVGIITPVYCGELPMIVKDFLQKVIVRGEYIWALAVSGGTVGTTLKTMDELLRYNEMRLKFGEMLMMPDNSIITMTKPEEIKSALQNEDRLVSEVIALLDEERQNQFPCDNFLGKSSKIQWASLKGVIGINKKKLDRKTCTGCEICVNICPMKNIVKVGDKIKIGPNCTNCFACLHWCPTHSIKAGFIKVNDNNQYTHPEVTAQELFKTKK